MKKNLSKRLFALLLALILVMTAVPFASAADAEDLDTAGNWVSAWSTSAIDASLSGLNFLDNVGVTLSFVTSRITIEPTMSGSSIRIKFSNEYGRRPLRIGNCNIAKTGDDDQTVIPSSMRIVTYKGNTSFSVPKGKTIYSDPTPIDVVAGEKLSISTFYNGFNTFRTIGLIGAGTYAAVGNRAFSKRLNGIKLSLDTSSGTYAVIPTIMEVDVDAAPGASACVFYGDSTVTNEIPRYYAKELRDKGIDNVSITQAAIKGNRLLEDGVGLVGKITGQSTLKRFEKDVLSQAGVKYVIVKIGVNDIVHPYCKSKQGILEPVNLDQMIEGYTEVVKMCHKAGVKVFFAELLPWKGYTRNIFGTGDDVNWTMEIDQLRLDINQWAKSKGCPSDGFISIPGMADPNDEFALRPDYTLDGAHHTDAGARAVASVLPIDIFK